MTRRAIISPRLWTQNTVLALGMGAAVILLGCGGGGGGGGQPPPGNGACGGGSGTVVCGYVQDSASPPNAVNGATVLLKTASGGVITQTTTAADSSGKGGFFKFQNVQANVLFEVDAPAPAFFPNTSKFGGNVYAYYVNASVGGPCDPAVTIANPGGENNIGVVTVYSQTAGPPPAPSPGVGGSNCPR